MTIPPPLADSALAAELENLNGWIIEDGKLHKEFVFDSFVQAFGFMASAALLAERAHHHPEWFNVYNRVRVDLVTHEAGGVTHFDTDLARAFDQVAAR